MVRLVVEVPCRDVAEAAAAVALAAALTATGMGSVSAQPSSTALPIELGGWRAIKEPNDLHVYVCDNPGCAPKSKVSFLLYSGTAIAPGQFHRQREMAAELLQESPAPCVFANGLALGAAPTPMRCVTTVPDGTKRYDTSGIVNGSRWSASLISSSSDEAASEANYRQFAAALGPVVNSGLGAKP